MSSATTTRISGEQIDGLLLAGARLTEIEDLIAASDLPEDEQAAAWLRAWSASESGQARRSSRRRASAAPPLSRPFELPS